MNLSKNYKVFIFRGIPGSGKNTWAEQKEIDHIFDSDSYFVKDGEYNFDPSELSQAHTYCYRQYLQTLPEIVDTDETIAVCNTNTTHGEYMPYVMAARAFGMMGKILLVHMSCKAETGFERNVHGAPMEAIEKMQERWEQPLFHHPQEIKVITEPGKEKVVPNQAKESI